MPETSTVFFTVIKYGKFALLTALLVLSFINGHKEYISANPRRFMWDNIAVGGTSALAIAVIAWMRGHTEVIPSAAFLSFLLFFVYNVFRELSGFNAAAEGEEELTQWESKQMKLFGRPVGALVIGITGFMVVLAIAAHVWHPQGMVALIKEAIVFGGFTALGEAVLAYNHGYDVKKAAVMNFVLFFFGQIILQLGGFYDHIFPKPLTLRV